MAIADDFSVDVSGNIRHISGTSTYTVLELHRWLQDLADNASVSGNDSIDITNDTPSERSTDNIVTLLGNYNIDATAAQYLYDGSITQDSGDEVYSGLVVVGSVASSTTLMIIQNNALYADGVHTPSSPFWGTDLNALPASNILMRCMIKTRTSGVDIDGKRIRVQARELGDTYAEFSATLGVGNSTAAIFTNTDLNNQTSAGTISGWSDVTNDTVGYNLIDLTNGNGSLPYYSKWNRGSRTINQLYERAKWLQRRGNTSTDIYNMDGELFRGVTHQWAYDTESGGPFTQNEVLSWGSGATAGTGALLALQDSGTTGTMWIQLLTGVAPTDNVSITGGTSSATCLVNGSVTARSVTPCFIGSSTGTSIIGGFGIGIIPDSLTSNDKLFDLTNTQQSPPNFVTFTVSGVITNEDYVLVGPATGSALKVDQLAIHTALTGSATNQIRTTTLIPTDTPSAGTIRVQINSGSYYKVAYSAYSASIFTITSTDFSVTASANANNNLYISYIDKLVTAASASFTSIYSSDRNLFVRVRDGGGSPIKTFETPATLGSAGGSVSAIRTTDA